MKALVTGSEGFVAPYLINELLSKGYEVIATYYANTPKLPSAVKTVKLDIQDRKEVFKVFDRHLPNVVFHLAGISSVKFSIDNPELTMSVNVEGTRNVIKSAEESYKSPSIVLIGSAEEYGIPENVPIIEEDPLDPNNPYAESKALAEEIGKESAKRGFRVILVRSFNHIGPGQSEEFVVASFAKQIAEIEKGKKKFIEVGNLEAKRDFTDVRDVVKAYVIAAEKCDPGDPYNICSGNAYAISDILDRLTRMSKVRIDIKEDPKRMRKSDIPILVGDNRKMFRKTGWRPAIDIDTSLREILEYWRKK